MTHAEFDFVTEHDPRTMWVFSLDVSPDELPAWEPDGADDQWPLPGALGVSHLDPAHVEVFPESRISEYGLARYLVEANGMSEKSVADAAQSLEAQTGTIVIVHGKAVEGMKGNFDPAHPAHFVGRFSERTSLKTSPVQPGPKVSQGTIQSGEAANPPDFPWKIIVIAIVALVILGAILWSLA